MPTYSGKFEFRAGNAAEQQGGACTLTFDEETFRLVSDQPPGFAMDLGDIDSVEAGDYQILLKIYDGTSVFLNQFGKTFENLQRDLLEMWHKRVIQCLLLKDLEEITRLDGFAQLESAERKVTGSAEIRLFKSNLAVLPVNAPGFQWRLADIEIINFDEAGYELELHSGDDRLTLTKLGRRTREFHKQLTEAAISLTDKCAQVIHALFPFLSPGQFMQAAGLMKEGRVIALSQLMAIHPSIGQALIQNAVRPRFMPYFNSLKQNAAAPGPYFGFKFIRKEEEECREEEAFESTDAAAEEEPARPLLEFDDESLIFWFAFPLAGDAAQTGPATFAAWECTSQTGRATYVFRLSPHPQSLEINAAIRRLNRGIVIVNFRREPIYLPDSSLETQPRFRHYAIAQRNIPALRNLRNLFAGRAIHKSLQEWQNQMNSLVRKKE